MKDLTKEQLEQMMKEHKQKTQLILVNDLLDKMQHLANKTIKADYEPRFEETHNIFHINRLADTILKNIS